MSGRRSLTCHWVRCSGDRLQRQSRLPDASAKRSQKLTSIKRAGAFPANSTKCGLKNKPAEILRFPELSDGFIIGAWVPE